MSKLCVVYNYPNQEAAKAIVAEANKLVIGAEFSVTLCDLSENDKKRGVGKWSVCFQLTRSNQATFMQTSKAQDVVDMAERVLLARELRKFNPSFPLLQSWWYLETSALAKFDFTDDAWKAL